MRSWCGAAWGRTHAGAIQTLLSVQLACPSRLACAYPRQARPVAVDHRAAVGDGVMELLERQSDRREIAVLDRAVVVAIERLPQQRVGIALHCRELLRGLGAAHPRDQRQQTVAMGDVALALVALHVMAQPGARRAEAGEQQDAAPDVVGVFFEEG